MSTNFPHYMVLTNYEKAIWKSVIAALITYGWPMSATSIIRAADEAGKRWTPTQLAAKLKWMSKLDDFPVSIHTNRVDCSENVHLYGLKDWFCDLPEYADLGHLPALRTPTQYQE